jgi:hypothetical protein
MVVDRQRIELIEPGVPTAPIHHEGGPHLLHQSSDPDVRASVIRATAAALDELELAASVVIDTIALRAWPAEFPEDLAILRRAPYESRADSVMYRALSEPFR